MGDRGIAVGAGGGKVAAFPKVRSGAEAGQRARAGSARRAYRRVALLVACTDMLALLAALVLAHQFRVGPGRLDRDLVLLLPLAPPFLLGLFLLFRLYALHLLPPAEEFRRLILATSLGITLLATLSFWSEASFSRLWVGLVWLLSTLFVLVSRRLWHWWIGRTRSRGGLSFRTAVVGAGAEAARIGEILDSGAHGFRAVGLVTTALTAPAVGSPVLGTVDDLVTVIREHDIDCLFVASTGVTESEMRAVMAAARAERTEVRVSANLPEMLTSRLIPVLVGRLPALALRPVSLSGFQRTLKRALDILVAAPLLLLVSPLLLAIAGALKLQDGGPVLFRQQRVTKGERLFTLLKFRTMVPDPDPEILAERSLDPRAAFFKVRDDPRVTRLGRWLRRWSLDELPQLWNVLRGQMSLVGPRPLPAEQVAANLQLLAGRHEVPAGLTGWWQIRGRSDLDPETSVRMDLFYVENWSVSLDVYILLKTVGVLLRGRGAI